MKIPTINQNQKKSKANPPIEAAKPPYDINEKIDEIIHDNPTADAEKLPCNPTSDIVNPVLTTEEVESMINPNIEEPTDLIMANDNIAKPTNVTTANKDPTTPAKFQFQCEICEFKCK